MTATPTSALAVRQPSNGATKASGLHRIDLHAHFLPPEYRASLLAQGYATIGGYPTPEWSPERALDFMGRYDIQAQVVSVSDPGVSYLSGVEARDMSRYCNSYAADLIRQHPTRFGAFAVLPMPDVSASIAELAHALDDLGLDGVVLLSAYDGVYLGDPRFEPLMAELARRHAYVFIHPAAVPTGSKPGLPLPDFLYEFTFETTRAAAQLMYSGTLQRHPTIRFHLAHAGGTVPFLSYRLGLFAEAMLPGAKLSSDEPNIERLDIPGAIRNLFYDTALSPTPAAMKSVLEASTREHIVFGSDWPFSELLFTASGDPQPQLAQTFGPTERMEIERGNAMRELPRLAGALTSG